MTTSAIAQTSLPIWTWMYPLSPQSGPQEFLTVHALIPVTTSHPVIWTLKIKIWINLFLKRNSISFYQWSIEVPQLSDGVMTPETYVCQLSASTQTDNGEFAKQKFCIAVSSDDWVTYFQLSIGQAIFDLSNWQDPKKHTKNKIELIRKISWKFF